MKIALSIFLLAMALGASAVPREGLSRMIREAKAAKQNEVEAGPTGPPEDACGNLITTMQSAIFEACDNIGFEFTTSDFSYKDTDASDFCKNNCAQLMRNTISQMVTQCNLPAENADIANENGPLWDAACFSFKDKRCDEHWLTMMSSQYMQCVAEHSDAWKCPDSCVHVMQGLMDDMGCCYKSIADVDIKNDPPLYFGDQLWHDCNVKEIDSCSV